MGVIQFIAGLLVLVSIAASDHLEWSYDPAAENGPPNWINEYPFCDDKKQSPINIVTEEAVPVSYEPFTFQGYQTGEDDSGSVVSIMNGGHVRKADISLDGFYGLSGGGLSTAYMALRAHFHWGVTDDVGSEHTIDGKQFPLEMHLVHFAHEKYNGSVVDAISSGNIDALAVFAILYEIGEEDNEAYEKIITGISNIPYEDDEHFFQEEISVFDLLPEDKSRFYRYNGSMTSPDCLDVVTWTVFADPITLSSDQIQKFRELMEGPRDDSRVIGNTFTPVFPIDGRTVYCNKGIPNYMTSLTFTVSMLFMNLLLRNN